MAFPNPIRDAIVRLNTATMRCDWHPGVQFTDPPGDPGWYGPGSAMWYVHGHAWALTFGLVASAAIENLHPDFAWMKTEHSDFYEVVDGVKQQSEDINLFLKRFSRSFSFFTSTAFGPSEVASRETRIVNAMHKRVVGNRPDGKPYSALDPATLRWAHNTVVWGIARAHTLYHPRPLRGADLDQYYAEYARIGTALGGTDLATTKTQVDEELAGSVPWLGVTAPAMDFFEQFDPRRYSPAIRPVVGHMEWAILDMLPDYCRRILRAGPRSNALVTRARRRTTWALVNALEYGGGHMPELQQAHERSAAPTPAETRAPAVAAG